MRKSPLKILFVGATWKGSSARSLREALSRLPDVFIDEVGEDHYLPLFRSRLLRGFNRILKPWQIADLRREISDKLSVSRPDVLIVYKGSGVQSDFIEEVKARGVMTVNVFPDVSPHAHGQALRRAMGRYDLVISTKPFHPEAWSSLYGYSNACLCVPHGYDPEVHYWPKTAVTQNFDVVLAASWRKEYHELMVQFAREVDDLALRIGIAGHGWGVRRNELPNNWQVVGPLYGRAYGEWIRQSKIVIAPVHTKMIIDGIRQPGDEDTTRTYELAAAFCFFLHRRTPYVKKVYDENTEVPMWSSAKELGEKVRYYLRRESERHAMAAAAHARAVPAYSTQSRAMEVLEHIRIRLNERMKR